MDSQTEGSKGSGGMINIGRGKGYGFGYGSLEAYGDGDGDGAGQGKGEGYGSGQQSSIYHGHETGRAAGIGGYLKTGDRISKENQSEVHNI